MALHRADAEAWNEAQLSLYVRSAGGYFDRPDWKVETAHVVAEWHRCQGLTAGNAGAPVLGGAVATEEIGHRKPRRRRGRGGRGRGASAAAEEVPEGEEPVVLSVVEVVLQAAGWKFAESS